MCRLGRALSRPSVCQTVEVLRLRSCGLDTLPDSVPSLPNLRELDLRDNEFRHVPPEAGEAPALVRLDMRGNPLAANPDLSLLRASVLLLWGDHSSPSSSSGTSSP